MSTKKKYTAAEKKAYGAGARAARAAASRSYSARSYQSRVSGKGDYKMRPPKAEKERKTKDSKLVKGVIIPASSLIGAGIGTAIAPGIGTSVGAGLGMLAGGLISKITGMGDYRVNVEKNSLLMGGSIPEFGPSSTRIRHKEYIGDISSSQDFTLMSFKINPGLDTTFPWLSSVAQNYQQWYPNGIIFFFDSQSADALNSTNTALGKVILATNYDAGAQNYENVQQMLGSELSNYGKPSECLFHAIECDPGETQMRLFTVRSGEVPEGQDPKTFDLGNFQVATQGSQASAVIGGLWVIYDITLVKPIQNNQLGLALNTDHLILVSPSQTGSNYLGSSRTVTAGSSLGCTYTNNTISFPPMLSAGEFLVIYEVYGSSTTVSDPTLSLTNCQGVGNMWNHGTQSQASNNSMTTVVYFLNFIVRITGQNATIVFSGGTLPSAGTYGDLYITQINSGLVPSS